jgi:hypothetical protein
MKAGGDERENPDEGETLVAALRRLRAAHDDRCNQFPTNVINVHVA